MTNSSKNGSIALPFSPQNFNKIKIENLIQANKKPKQINVKEDLKKIKEKKNISSPKKISNPKSINRMNYKTNSKKQFVIEKITDISSPAIKKSKKISQEDLVNNFNHSKEKAPFKMVKFVNKKISEPALFNNQMNSHKLGNPNTNNTSLKKYKSVNTFNVNTNKTKVTNNTKKMSRAIKDKRAFSLNKQIFIHSSDDLLNRNTHNVNIKKQSTVDTNPNNNSKIKSEFMNNTIQNVKGFSNLISNRNIKKDNAIRSKANKDIFIKNRYKDLIEMYFSN